MFFKNKKLNKELDVLLAGKKYDEIIETVKSSSVDAALSEQTEKRLALTYYYKQDYENSLNHFQNIADNHATTENLFNVMTSLLALKDINRAKSVYDTIVKTHRGVGRGKKFVPELTIPYIRYYYASGCADAGAFEEALARLDEIKKIYIELNITDSTFLYIRGVPFFGSFIQLAQKVFEGQGKDLNTSEFLDELKSGVDSDGVAIIKELCKTES